MKLEAIFQRNEVCKPVGHSDGLFNLKPPALELVLVVFLGKKEKAANDYGEFTEQGVAGLGWTHENGPSASHKPGAQKAREEDHPFATLAKTVAKEQ